MTLHTYNPQPMSLPSINFLHLTVAEVQAGQTSSQRPPTHPDTMHENNTPGKNMQVLYLLKVGLYHLVPVSCGWGRSDKRPFREFGILEVLFKLQKSRKPFKPKVLFLSNCIKAHHRSGQWRAIPGVRDIENLCDRFNVLNVLGEQVRHIHFPR